MTRNVGAADKAVRMTLGLLLIAFGLFVAADPIWKAVAFVLAAVMLITAIAGTCPLYTMIGIDTHGHHTKGAH